MRSGAERLWPQLYCAHFIITFTKSFLPEKMQIFFRIQIDHKLRSLLTRTAKIASGVICQQSVTARYLAADW